MATNRLTLTQQPFVARWAAQRAKLTGVSQAEIHNLGVRLLAAITPVYEDMSGRLVMMHDDGSHTEIPGIEALIGDLLLWNESPDQG